jgi:hypothetical protein
VRVLQVAKWDVRERECLVPPVRHKSLARRMVLRETHVEAFREYCATHCDIVGQGVDPYPSGQTCLSFNTRKYHEMCRNITHMISDLLRFVDSNPTFMSRIHSMLLGYANMRDVVDAIG